jgi:Hg(II)-responsive transcriptional regulator
MMNESGFTIGKLAQAAGVGVETVRYYQRRNLLPMPVPKEGAFRTYSPVAADRIRFIKRAQNLGFTLEEIATLLQLENGSDRNAIRKVASDRQKQIRDKIADLQRMQRVLSQLIDACAVSGQANHCPIISALNDGNASSGAGVLLSAKGTDAV